MKRVELVVVAGERVRLFASVAAAEARLDPAALRAAPPEHVFDRAGLPHRLRIDDNGWGQETLRIVARAGAMPEPQALAAKLAAFLASRGVALRGTATLEELLRRAQIFCEG